MVSRYQVFINGKFGDSKSKKTFNVINPATEEAIEVGIRTGFAYLTLGTVSSPLDGFINIEFKERLDKKGKYMCVNYAGPIRNAGGTPSSVSVLIADYLRTLKGF